MSSEVIMQREEEEGLMGENFHQTPQSEDGDGSSLSAKFFLGHVGEVVVTFTGNGFAWNLVEPVINFVSDKEQKVNFADVLAVDLIQGSLINRPSDVSNVGGSLLQQLSEQMHWFRVHVVGKSKARSPLLSTSVYTFGNRSLQICKDWVDLINAKLDTEATRPKNLLVFVHPRSGKRLGCRIWETVAPLFLQAGVKTKVLVTERAGHARDLLAAMPNTDLSTYDGCIAVGGDGFFNEILNGVLLPRHKAPYPPAPGESMLSSGTSNNFSPPNVEHSASASESCCHNGDGFPLLTTSGRTRSQPPRNEEDPGFCFPSETFRFGIIPAGSTDAIVMCTAGVRDPVTCALHIILGRRVLVDIAQLVRWKRTSASNKEICVRYAASFAGYGFYGDVIVESEKCRWMGPKRYDVAGTKVFLKHRSYEAEVAYLEEESEKNGNDPAAITPSSFLKKRSLGNCRANCAVCSGPNEQSQRLKWSSSRGSFLSVGAAIISCRNDKAPDGLVADAHLSDGFLHLLLIRDCPLPSYLMHLIQIARRGGDPLDFPFVEHHKTPAFTFKSHGREGVWNVDGEVFQAHLLSAQVFRGLISLYGTGLDG